MANQNGAVAELLQHSVTEGDAFVSAHSGGLAYYVLPIMSGYSGNVGLLPLDPPRYWCLERDMLLRATVLHENLWASAINIAQTKTASLSFDVEGEKPLNVKRAQEMMLTLDGEGWVKAQSKGVRDYLTCDNGEWWEIVRASSAVGSRILGLVHLDSLRTLRTGDDERPAMYMDLRGRYHELRDYQVINLTDMPSPAAEFLGVGLCAASRAYSHIYKMANIERYVNEKISGSRPQEIHFINGVMPKQLDAALRGADEAQAQRGAVNFKGALVVPMPAGTTVTGYVVPLSELPDGFDRKQEFDLAVTIYADAIGLDPQDLQPLSGQGLGTGTQSRVLAEKSKGKGLAARQKQWTHEMNEKVFSEGVTFIFQERDLDDELKQAEVEGERAATRGTMIGNGEITAIEARQLAVDSDDLPKEFTPPTGDVTPDDILSDEEKPMVGELDPIPLPDLLAPKVQLPPLTTKSVNEVLREFKDTLTRWVVDAANGNKTAGDMSRAMRSTQRRLAPQAYTEGMREGGVADPESELDEADETQIDNWLGQQGEFVLEFARDAAKVSDLAGDEKTAARRAILDRAALWENSLRTLGSLGYASAKANMSVTWEYSDTEHCPTCRRLNGVTHRLRWFTQKNYLPQSPGAAMDCGGFNCKCRLVDKSGKTVMP